METKEIANTIIKKYADHAIIPSRVDVYYYLRDNDTNTIRLNRAHVTIDNLESEIDYIKRTYPNLIAFWDEPSASKLNDRWGETYRSNMLSR